MLLIVQKPEGSVQKVFFEIPDPTKLTEKLKLCKLWIDHLRNDKLKLETFVYNRNKLVCEDHLEHTTLKEMRFPNHWVSKQENQH